MLRRSQNQWLSGLHAYVRQRVKCFCSSNVITPAKYECGSKKLFSCDQTALWMVLSVRLSDCHTMFPSWYHHEFLWVIANAQGEVYAKGQGQRLKVKVTDVKTQHKSFRPVTPVWIHIWWWNDAQSLMLLRRGALLFSRSSIKFQSHTDWKI